MNNLFICYPKCTTCKKAQGWLKQRGITFETRDIKTDNPTKEELIMWITRSKKDTKSFFNTSGLKYKELNLKEKLKNMSDDEKLELLQSDGMLVKRPIFVTESKVFVGFKEKEWEEIM